MRDCIYLGVIQKSCVVYRGIMVESLDYNLIFVTDPGVTDVYKTVC
jgi:hypothetical protein